MIILFDLDGTLIDSTDAIVDSFYDVFRFFKLDSPSRVSIVSLIGYPLEDMFTKLGIQDNIEKYVLKYKEFYRPRSLGMTTLLPGAMEAIDLASKIAKLGIVTTKISERTGALLENMKVRKYFDVLVGRDNVVKPKPDPEPVLKALEQFEYDENEHIFMIGDTYMDVAAANGANVLSIGVLCGSGTRASFMKYNATYICENSLEAVILIQKKYASS